MNVPYIIDQANVLKDKRLECCSIVVNENRIDYINKPKDRYQFIRMPVNEFVLTPGHVMLDFSFQQSRTFMEFKQYVQQNFIFRGCTTLLAVCDVRYERQLPKAIQQLRKNLLNSPIDYYIGVKIPLQTLTPSFVRACKRSKIPVIFIELGAEDRLNDVAWYWIYEALYSYFITFVPVWRDEQARASQQKTWGEILTSNKIPFIPFALKEHTPIPLDALKKIGIYPQKGDIRIGGEVDYNLYDKQKESRLVAQKAIVDYDIHVPTITVHKGRLLKAGEQLYFYPGFGKELIVQVPGMFAAYFDDRKG
jgi:hypothetical protein